MDRPEDALLERFRRLGRRHQPLDALQDLEGVLAFAHRVERVLIGAPDVDRPGVHAGALAVTPGAGQPAAPVRFHGGPTVPTVVLRLGMSPTLGTGGPDALRAAVRTPAPADVDLDLAGRVLHVVRVLGRGPDVPLVAPGLANREQAVDRRVHLPDLGLLRTPHPTPDARRGALPDREGRDLVDRGEGIPCLSGGRRQPFPVPGEGVVEPERPDQRPPCLDDDRLTLVMGDE